LPRTSSNIICVIGSPRLSRMRFQRPSQSTGVRGPHNLVTKWALQRWPPLVSPSCVADGGCYGLPGAGRTNHRRTTGRGRPRCVASRSFWACAFAPCTPSRRSLTSACAHQLLVPELCRRGFGPYFGPPQRFARRRTCAHPPAVHRASSPLNRSRQSHHRATTVRNLTDIGAFERLPDDLLADPSHIRRRPPTEVQPLRVAHVAAIRATMAAWLERCLLGGAAVGAADRQQPSADIGADAHREGEREHSRPLDHCFAKTTRPPDSRRAQIPESSSLPSPPPPPEDSDLVSVITDFVPATAPSRCPRVQSCRLPTWPPSPW